MRRRAFIAALGGAAAWPIAARAQQPAVPVVGYLAVVSSKGAEAITSAFHRGLSEAGYSDGRNVVIEYRFAEGQTDRLPSLAADLVSRQVTAIAAMAGSASALAAKAATPTIPIIFTMGDVDPVEAGLVSSLAHPGSNVTGVSFLGGLLGAKRLELLRELVPNVVAVGVLVNPNNQGSRSDARDLQAAVVSGQQRLVVVNAGPTDDLETAFATVAQQRIEALIVTADPIFYQPARAARGPSRTFCGSDNLSMGPVRFFRGPHQLRGRPCGRISPSGCLYRTRSQGRKTQRPSRLTADQIRAQHQSENRQGSRPHHSANTARPRRRGDRMKRREFMAALGGAAAAWPMLARAQQPAMPVVGFISPKYDADLAAFRRGLYETGYTEGRNVTIDIRWLEDKSDRVPAIVADLVARQVTAIASTTAGALAAKRETSTIPIVFATGGDPVDLGLVASLNRPDGNLAGVTFLAPLMESKRLGLLHEMAPQASVIAALLDPNGPIANTQAKEVPEAARALGLRLAVQHASAERDLDSAFAAFAQARAGALLVTAAPFFDVQHEKVVAQAARHMLPAIYGRRESAEAGRADELRDKPYEFVSSGRRLHRANTQRRKACRLACTATHQVRVRDQPQNREGSWDRGPSYLIRPR
jgi:putative tryptophan/tyrosine transport system substrate-binding protein